MGEAITVKTNMEMNIIRGLQRLNIDVVKDLAALQGMITSKEFSPPFIKLVTWLTSQLIASYSLSETVSGESDMFAIEVKGVLRELGCPYGEVMEGDGISTVKGRLFLLDYLISEVQAARINSSLATVNGTTEESQQVDDNPITSSLFTITKVLGVPIVPDKSRLFVDITTKINQLLASLPQYFLKDPLLQRQLNAKQWKQAATINDALCQEYKMRRDVLIKRVEVTIKSFSWSDRTKRLAKDIDDTFKNFKTKLLADSLTSVVDILAARKDLCIIEKTCYGEARKVTECKINKHLIGRVPDRGGRPSKEAPPPEPMPSFQQRKPDRKSVV